MISKIVKYIFKFFRILQMARTSLFIINKFNSSEQKKHYKFCDEVNYFPHNVYQFKKKYPLILEKICRT